MSWIWFGFIGFVLGLLALDLGVFHRKDHVIKTREALAWSAIWISLALLFSVFIYFGYERHWLGLGASADLIDGEINHGRQAVVKYITGYVIEKSLSVDNIFVIAILFSYFAVPAMYQHRVLFWGILGAIGMRGLMIYVWSELVFAVDSIPAIFAITGDPFLVFTSNIFAILGLRSLYFALAGMMDKFRYLKAALAVVLIVVGIKMLAATWLKAQLGEHFNLYLLGAVFAILAAGVGASVRANRKAPLLEPVTR